MHPINILYTRGQQYVERAKHAKTLILIGIALLVVVALGEIIASGYPGSSLAALFAGRLDSDISYVLGLLGDVAGIICLPLGIALKAGEDKGLMMMGIAMTYSKIRD